MAAAGPPVLVRRVAEFLDDGDTVPQGSHVLVAVSGGPDSTALAAALAELAPTRGLRLTLVHLRHGLRSEHDEAADEAAVRALAATLGTDVRVRALRVPPGGNLEARARLARRRAWRAMAAECGAQLVALGHTQDDQAETFLLRLLRGGGRAGLAGMRVRTGALVRPLLSVSRADVRWYLTARGLTATLDRTNADLRHTRNRVRRLLVPWLASEFNPRVTAALAALAGRLRDEDDVLETATLDHVRRLCAGDRLRCDVTALPVALGRRVVRTWLLALGLHAPSALHIERVLRAAGGGRSGVALPGSHRIVREGAVLVCRQGAVPVAREFCIAVAPGGTVEGPAGRLELGAARPWGPGESPARAGEAAIMDADALVGTLAIRSPRRGDRVHVPRVGTRKLHDVLVDRKVPRERRGVLAVLTVGEAVVWIPGVLRTSVARVGEATRRVVEARWVSDDKPALPLEKSCGTLAERGGRPERGSIE